MILLAVAISFCAAESCTGKKKKNTTETAGSTEQVQPRSTRTFKIPDVPMSITDESERITYLARHFWDNIDYSNNVYADNDNTEQAFADYLMVLNNLPDMKAVANTVTAMMKRLETEATPEMYEYITGLYEKYLYDPNSPYRSEEIYITVLESIVANPKLEEIEKVRPESQLRMAKKNRPGDKAFDFSYRTAQGKSGSLYGVKADYLLVFFYNLGCPACKEVRAGLAEVFAEPGMAALLSSGRLKVLAVYPDEDMTEWDKYVEDIPAEWINAYDPAQEINKNELYDLRAIPSLYLLDKDKKVMLKDFIDPTMLYYAVTDAESRK